MQHTDYKRELCKLHSTLVVTQNHRKTQNIDSFLVMWYVCTLCWAQALSFYPVNVHLLLGKICKCCQVGYIGPKIGANSRFKSIILFQIHQGFQCGSVGFVSALYIDGHKNQYNLKKMQHVQSTTVLLKM